MSLVLPQINATVSFPQLKLLRFEETCLESLDLVELKHIYPFTFLVRWQNTRARCPTHREPLSRSQLPSMEHPQQHWHPSSSQRRRIRNPLPASFPPHSFRRSEHCRQNTFLHRRSPEQKLQPPWLLVWLCRSYNGGHGPARDPMLLGLRKRTVRRLLLQASRSRRRSVLLQKCRWSMRFCRTRSMSRYTKLRLSRVAWLTRCGLIILFII